jgi:hypothetical protein
LRAGLQLARHYLEKRAARLIERPEVPDSPLRVAERSPHREKKEVTPQKLPQIRVWGRRAWGKRRRDGETELEVEEFYWQTDGS